MTGTERRYITVLLPLKIEWEPYYSVPDGIEAMTGDWVNVVFANRSYQGIVTQTGVIPETRPEKIRDISGKSEGLKPVIPEEIRLWRMVADYYLCTVGEVFKAAYPMMKISEAEKLARRQEAERQRRLRMTETLNLKIGKIAERLLKKQEKLANSEKVLIEKEKLSQKKEKELAALKEAIAKLQDELGRLKERLAGIAGPDRDGSGNGEGDSFGNGNGNVEGDSFGNGNGDGGSGREHRKIALNRAQETVCEAVRQSEGRPVLIHGVTGSGKTEIYLELAKEAMDEGKNVLYLVPEIAMSSQLQERVREVFGENLLVFHSEETASSRRETAERIRGSRICRKPYIVLGTRSSLFLPHCGLGLIIVDEEHDGSYKQDSPAPRYNGRDVAVMLSTIHECRIVLGSATPSLESLFNAGCGKYSLQRLRTRFYGADDAEVEIVDTNAERRKRGMKGSFSLKLIARMEEAMSKGGQILLLRARRAFSPVLQCPECGEIPKCPHCNVSLSLHKNPDRMMCHHCGLVLPFNPRCGKCGAVLQGIGSGTQKIEEELTALFPEARIARIDGDTPKPAVDSAVKDFNSGRTDILVGTQIIAKGFDFPGLTLTAVISADSLLGLQDFRADEKAFQVLEQLRGRCGRRDNPGVFVVQTAKPEHPVYKLLAHGSEEEFYGSLMQERKDFGYPPFTRIINLTVRDASEESAENMSRQLAEDIRAALTGNGGAPDFETVTPPYRPPVDKVAGNYIRTIRITLKKDRQMHRLKKAVAGTVSGFEERQRYRGHIVIDVDPE